MKTKHLQAWSIIVATLLISSYVLVTMLTTPAFAAVSLSPDKDDFASQGDGATNFEDTLFLLIGSAGTGPASCTAQGSVVMGFDLTGLDGVPTNITTATLTLDANATALTGGAGASGDPSVLTLWGHSGDDTGWSEGNGNLTMAGRPSKDVNLNTTAAGLTAPTGSVTFNSSAAFASYVDTEIATDEYITILVEAREGVDGDCNPATNPFMEFDSKETTKTGRMIAANLVLEGTGPTAVTVLGTEVTPQNANMVIWIAGILFVLALGAGVILLRRRPTEQQTIA